MSASLREQCREAARKAICEPRRDLPRLADAVRAGADGVLRIVVEACAAHVEQAQVSAGPCGQLELAARIRALLDEGAPRARRSPGTPGSWRRDGPRGHARLVRHGKESTMKRIATVAILVAALAGCRGGELTRTCWTNTEDCSDAAVSAGPGWKWRPGGVVSCLCRDKQGTWRELWRKK